MELPGFGFISLPQNVLRHVSTSSLERPAPPPRLVLLFVHFPHVRQAVVTPPHTVGPAAAGTWSVPAAAAACLCPYDMACAAADNATAACFTVPAEVQAARHNFSAFGQEGQGPGQNPVCRVTPESIPTLFFFIFPLTFVGETWFGEDMVGKWLGGGGVPLLCLRNSTCFRQLQRGGMLPALLKLVRAANTAAVPLFHPLDPDESNCCCVASDQTRRDQTDSASPEGHLP